MRLSAILYLESSLLINTFISNLVSCKGALFLQSQLHLGGKALLEP